MATPVIQSFGTGSADSGTTVTITKPTGLAVGNLMVSLVFTYEPGGRIISDLAGWTTLAGTNQTTINAKAFWKIADAADVAASNFTFNLSAGGVDSVRGIIFRITGHSSSAPVSDFFLNTLNIGLITNPSWNPNVLPQSNETLLIAGIINANLSTSSAEVDAYLISGTNPTWTEQYTNKESSDHLIGVATAGITSASEITNLEFTLSHTCAGHIGILISIPSADPVVATPASIALRTQQSAPTVAAAVNATPASVALVLESPDPSINVGSNVWTPVDKS